MMPCSWAAFFAPTARGAPVGSGVAADLSTPAQALHPLRHFSDGQRRIAPVVEIAVGIVRLKHAEAGMQLILHVLPVHAADALDYIDLQRNDSIRLACVVALQVNLQLNASPLDGWYLIIRKAYANKTIRQQHHVKG